MGTRPASTHSLPRRPAERLSLEVPRLWHWGLAVDQGGERLPPHLGKHADPGGSRSLIQVNSQTWRPDLTTGLGQVGALNTPPRAP